MAKAKPSSSKTRIERDSMGEMPVPADALYGASTERARRNFPVSGRTVPAGVVHAFGHLKAACAEANQALGKLDAKRAELIVRAADEVAAGEHDRHFVVDVYQTGSGTSTNMNANEVIANRCSQLAKKPIGSKDPVHPNDHVNMGQSSNDTFPSALHIAGALALKEQLRPALARLHKDLAKKARRWDKVNKIGRTHLMDATPIRMGQVFGGYAAQAERAVVRCDHAIELLGELAIGGTAVGTGINTHPKFAGKVCTQLRKRTRLNFREATNHVEAQSAKDSVVEAHGELRTIALSLGRIASDIRLLGSGPRCGIGELKLPAIQPGSSIMPGKVNPVISESVVQVSCRVLGNDVAIAGGNMGGVGSFFELNVAMPMMADALLESIQLLSGAANIMVDKLLDGMEVDRERCADLVERSLMLATALAPVIGYDEAARLAKRAHAEGKNIRELALEEELLDAKELDRVLDVSSMTEPQA